MELWSLILMGLGAAVTGIILRTSAMARRRVDETLRGYEQMLYDARDGGAPPDSKPTAVISRRRPAAKKPNGAP